MTCIIGLEHEGSIYIGGDSAGVAGSSIYTRADEKVFIHSNKMIMGFTSSYRMGQILRYSFNIPDHDPRISDMKYLVDVFTNKVRECFKDKGYGGTNDDGDIGGCFLLGYNGNLYTIDSDFQVGLQYINYNAVGYGSDLALGSMHTTHQYDIEPEERITLALDAASCFNMGVAAPYTILKLEG